MNFFLIKKKVCTLFIPISANIDYGNHGLPWAPHCLLPQILIMYVHTFPICSFYKNNHPKCNIKLHNNIKREKLKIKTYISFLNICIRISMSIKQKLKLKKSYYTLI